MAGLEIKTFDSPDDAHPFAAGEPGCRSSEHVKPAGTASCQTAHLDPRDAVYIAPGHAAWIVGDEPCEFIDLGQIENYAKPQ